MVAEMLKEIPKILEYFVPGYITIAIYKALMGIDAKNKPYEKIQIAACICVSYVLAIIFSSLEPLFARVSCEILGGVLLSVFFVLLLRVETVRHYYSLINHTLIEKTVFESIKLDEHPWVTVFMKDSSMVFGRIITYGDQDDPWIAVDNYYSSGPVFDDKDKKNGKRDDWSEELKTRDELHVIIIKRDEIKAIVRHKEDKIKKSKFSKNKLEERLKKDYKTQQ